MAGLHLRRHLILNRSFAREPGHGLPGRLLASPVSGAQLFFGKCLANYVLIVICGMHQSFRSRVIL